MLQGLWAVILTVVSPGLGLIYSGRWAAGTALNALLLLIAAAVVLSMRAFPPTPGNVAIGCLAVSLCICLQIAAIVSVTFFVAAGRLRKGKPGWFRTTWFAAIFFLPLSFAVGHNAHRNWHSFYIPTGAMLPVLQPGDVIVADCRPGYTPSLGDVFVFKTANGEDWVKRVVGLPGDRVSLDHGIVSINGVEATRTNHRAYRGPISDSAPDASNELSVYTETLPGGAAHDLLIFSDYSPDETLAEVAVPEDSYFMLGDNRDNSNDSRFPEIGFIPRNAMIGRVLTIAWSSDRTRILQHVP